MLTPYTKYYLFALSYVIIIGGFVSRGYELNITIFQSSFDLKNAIRIRLKDLPLGVKFKPTHKILDPWFSILVCEWMKYQVLFEKIKIVDFKM